MAGTLLPTTVHGIFSEPADTDTLGRELAGGAWHWRTDLALALVRWRTGRHRNALWKSLVLPAGGVALAWLLLMTLWLPLERGRLGGLARPARLGLVCVLGVPLAIAGSGILLNLLGWPALTDIVLHPARFPAA